MTDTEFYTLFTTHKLEIDDFKHLGHLRIGWIYLQKFTLEDALTRFSEDIYAFAKSKGGEAIYHDTLTKAWLRILHKAQQAAPVSTFDAFIEIFPELRDKSYPNQFYTESLLWSDKAKTSWCAPDLKDF